MYVIRHQYEDKIMKIPIISSNPINTADVNVRVYCMYYTYMLIFTTFKIII